MLAAPCPPSRLSRQLAVRPLAARPLAVRPLASCAATEPVAVRRARAAEVLGGRCAFLGLLATSVVGNLSGLSVAQQYVACTPAVWTAVAAVAGATLTRPGVLSEGFTREDAKGELPAGRASMVAMAVLVAAEAVCRVWLLP